MQIVEEKNHIDYDCLYEQLRASNFRNYVLRQNIMICVFAQIRELFLPLSLEDQDLMKNPTIMSELGTIANLGILN